jgi:hypothetical protein
MGKKRKKDSKMPETSETRAIRQDFESGPADFGLLQRYLTGDTSQKLPERAKDISTKPRDSRNKIFVDETDEMKGTDDSDKERGDQ